jgi:hypothetical protein
MTSLTNLDYLEIYNRVELQVVPLFPRSKIPVKKNWTAGGNLEWSRNYLRGNPDANLGLLLGRVVDVEGDTPEANYRLDDLTTETPHPFYRSSRSIHHLFLNPDPKLTIVKADGIEFRGKGHQSVLPPSIHENGKKYSWLDGSAFPIPAMPPRLLQYYLQHKAVAKRPKLKPGHIRVWCSHCEKQVYLHNKRYCLEKIAFADLGSRWECHSCREVDVRQACREIRKAGRNQ